jgi:phage terminase large subunit-like protein
MSNVSFACPDWWEKLQRGETPIPDLPLDEIEADSAVGFFDKLVLPDVAGQPTMGEAGGDWFRDILRATFGAVEWRQSDREDGSMDMVRLVGELFILVPKKNGKTTYTAALGIVALLMNRRPNITGVIVGPTQQVAETCFAQAAAMIEADPYLKNRFHIIPHKMTIVDLHVDVSTGVRMNARLKIKSFDRKVITGTIPAFAILDELHLMAEDAHALRVIGQIRGGMITNPESLLVFITTQSEIPPAGVFKAELDYARDVRDGKKTTRVRMLPVLYEFPVEIQASKDQPWRDPALWPLVLPNLGRGFTLERLLDDYQQAIDKGGDEERRWISQHLNIQMGMSTHADAWSGAQHWLSCAEPNGMTLEELLARSEVCTVGVDWGGADDLASVAVLGRERETKLWLHWSMTWARPSVLEARQAIAPRLMDFAAAGELAIVETPEEQAEQAADLIALVVKAGVLPEKAGVGLDVAGVALLLDALNERGLVQPLLEPVKQGWALTQAVSTVALKLESRRLRHAGQAIMAWAVGNAKQELKGNNYMVTKQVSGAAKIDPVMATFNAAMLMFLNPTASDGGTSFWEAA